MASGPPGCRGLLHGLSKRLLASLGKSFSSPCLRQPSASPQMLLGCTSESQTPAVAALAGHREAAAVVGRWWRWAGSHQAAGGWEMRPRLLPVARSGCSHFHLGAETSACFHLDLCLWSCSHRGRLGAERCQCPSRGRVQTVGLVCSPRGILGVELDTSAFPANPSGARLCGVQGTWRDGASS